MSSLTFRLVSYTWGKKMKVLSQGVMKLSSLVTSICTARPPPVITIPHSLNGLGENKDIYISPSTHNPRPRPISPLEHDPLDPHPPLLLNYITPSTHGISHWKHISGYSKSHVPLNCQPILVKFDTVSWLIHG